MTVRERIERTLFAVAAIAERVRQFVTGYRAGRPETSRDLVRAMAGLRETADTRAGNAGLGPSVVR